MEIQMQIIDVCVANHITYTASNVTMMMMILDFDMLDGNIWDQTDSAKCAISWKLVLPFVSFVANSLSLHRVLHYDSSVRGVPTNCHWCIGACHFLLCVPAWPSVVVLYLSLWSLHTSYHFSAVIVSSQFSLAVRFPGGQIREGTDGCLECVQIF